jgi:hypothetical protein
MLEYIVNLHMHTIYSDGTSSHAEIAAAARRVGIDVVIITDHNILVNGIESYFPPKSNSSEKPVLLLVGEEIHDQARDPQKNHLLVFGADRELAQFASDPQQLINIVQEVGGLSFLAHIHDPEAPAVGEDDLSWEDWEVQGFNGIELWNAMSEFKSLLRSKPHAIFYAYNPSRVATGPFPQAITKWDKMLASGERIVAIGGSDAHALKLSLGPLRRVVFPYEFHFKAINTHILTPKPLSQEVESARHLVYNALRMGHCFIGYDLPAPTRGFRFTAHTDEGVFHMGDEVFLRSGVTLQIHLPHSTECQLIKDGTPIRINHRRTSFAHTVTEPGVYRIEAYIHYKGKKRAWIFSNPIYLRNPKNSKRKIIS